MNATSKRSATGGYATAEIAVALPAVMIVVLMAVWLLGCVGAQLRCVDAARAAARAAARGDAVAQVVEVARSRAPRGAEVAVSTGDQVVRVTVRAEVHPLGALVGRLPGTAVSALAVAEREPPPVEVGPAYVRPVAGRPVGLARSGGPVPGALGGLP